MSRYILTHRAEEEIIELFAYSIEAFGRLKALEYRASLMHCFELLADNPQMGRPAPAIDPKVRRHEHESHIILYELDDDAVVILAIVHKRNIRKLKI